MTWLGDRGYKNKPGHLVPRPNMQVSNPRLLVSIRNATEAAQALAGGADLIDIKEPARGPLGPPDHHTRQSVIDTVRGRKPVSTAMGELATQPPTPLPPGIDYAKVGLAHAPHDWPHQLTQYQAAIAPTPLIPVAYADAAPVAAPPPHAVLQWAHQHHAPALLIDTAIKTHHNLLDWLNTQDLARLIRQAHDTGLMIALAGSLTGHALYRVAQLGPDIIAVRTAACENQDRLQSVTQARVRTLVNAMINALAKPAAPPARCAS